MTPEWFSIPIPKEEWAKQFISKSKMIWDAAEKWLEHSNDIFNVLTNRMVFKNSAWESISVDDFLLRLEELWNILKPSDLSKVETQKEFVRALFRMRDYLQTPWNNLDWKISAFKGSYSRIQRKVYETKNIYKQDEDIRKFSEKIITFLERTYNSIIPK